MRLPRIKLAGPYMLPRMAGPANGWWNGARKVSPDVLKDILGRMGHQAQPRPGTIDMSPLLTKLKGVLSNTMKGPHVRQTLTGAGIGGAYGAISGGITDPNRRDSKEHGGMAALKGGLAGILPGAAVGYGLSHTPALSQSGRDGLSLYAAGIPGGIAGATATGRYGKPNLKDKLLAMLNPSP